MKVINDIWLTNPYIEDGRWQNDVIVGIIKAKDENTGNNYYYVGQCLGKNYKNDVESILDFGVKYNEEDFKNFINSI